MSKKPKRGRPVTTGLTPKWQFRCPPEVKAAVEIAAKRLDITATEFLLGAVRDRLKRAGQLKSA